jgi:hypothetical protein
MGASTFRKHIPQAQSYGCWSTKGLANHPMRQSSLPFRDISRPLVGWGHLVEGGMRRRPQLPRINVLRVTIPPFSYDTFATLASSLNVH